jgi:hypothetical protein
MAFMGWLVSFLTSLLGASNMDRPPCWPEGQSCPNACAEQLRTRVIRNQTPLYGEWTGWRLAGRCLVSPDGDRISPERLRGILFAEAGRRRIEKRRCGTAAIVPILPAREQFAGSA